MTVEEFDRLLLESVIALKHVTDGSAPCPICDSVVAKSQRVQMGVALGIMQAIQGGPGTLALVVLILGAFEAGKQAASQETAKQRTEVAELEKLFQAPPEGQV